jgi:hypothetical protein
MTTSFMSVSICLLRHVKDAGGVAVSIAVKESLIYMLDGLCHHCHHATKIHTLATTTAIINGHLQSKTVVSVLVRHVPSHDQAAVLMLIWLQSHSDGVGSRPPSPLTSHSTPLQVALRTCKYTELVPGKCLLYTPSTAGVPFVPTWLH